MNTLESSSTVPWCVGTYASRMNVLPLIYRLKAAIDSL